MFRLLINKKSGTTWVREYGETTLSWIKRTETHAWKQAPDLDEQGKMDAFILMVL